MLIRKQWRTLAARMVGRWSPKLVQIIMKRMPEMMVLGMAWRRQNIMRMEPTLNMDLVNTAEKCLHLLMMMGIMFSKYCLQSSCLPLDPEQFEQN